jgi:hypothetical protein
MNLQAQRFAQTEDVREVVQICHVSDNVAFICRCYQINEPNTN